MEWKWGTIVKYRGTELKTICRKCRKGKWEHVVAECRSPKITSESKTRCCIFFDKIVTSWKRIVCSWWECDKGGRSQGEGTDKLCQVPHCFATLKLTEKCPKAHWVPKLRSWETCAIKITALS